MEPTMMEDNRRATSAPPPQRMTGLVFKCIPLSNVNDIIGWVKKCNQTPRNMNMFSELNLFAHLLPIWYFLLQRNP